MTFYSILEVVGTILAAALAITGVAAMAGVAYSQFTKGKQQDQNDITSSSSELTGFWREQVDGFKSMVAAQNVKIEELTRDINKMRGELDSKNTQIKDLQDTLNLRNPEMKQFMEFMVKTSTEQGDLMRQSIKDSSEANQAILVALNGLHETSLSNHEMLDSRKREVKIEGTLTKQ